MNRSVVFRLIPLFAAAVVAATPLLAQGDLDISSRTITVVGDGEVKVAPDEAIIPMVLRTEAREVGEARKQNDAALKDLRALLSRLGVPEGSISVDYISISPQQSGSDEYSGLSSRYRGEEGEAQPLGYYASRNLVVRVNNLKALEDLLTSAATMKPLYLGPVQMRSTAATQHREKARVEAMRSARGKAALMAGELGATIGRPVAISESNVLEDYLSSKGGSSSAYAASLYAMLSGGGGDGSSFQIPNEIVFSTRVRVTFELE